MGENGDSIDGYELEEGSGRVEVGEKGVVVEKRKKEKEKESQMEREN